MVKVKASLAVFCVLLLAAGGTWFITRAFAGSELVSASPERARTIGQFSKCYNDDSLATTLYFQQQECGDFRVTSITPSIGANEISVDTTINLKFSHPLEPDVESSMSAYALVDGRSVVAGMVRNSIVVDLPRTSLSFKFDQPLPEETDIQLHVYNLAGQRENGSRAGGFFVIGSDFTTGGLNQVANLKFNRSKVSDMTVPTSLAMSNSNKLYVSSYIGQYTAFNIGANGVPFGGPQNVGNAPGGYAGIGIAFDPDDPSKLYATEWKRENAVDQYNSQLVRYSVAGSGNLFNREILIDGLERHPHPAGDHGPHSMIFRDGKLYLSVGSATSGGNLSPSFWGEPRLRESDSTATILEVDYKSMSSPIDNRWFTFTPVSSPARIYATGVRNAYDMVAHSNGRIYANVNQNGSSTQDGAAPNYGRCANAPNQNVDSSTIQDTLIQVERGRYYGHPNETRGECIVLGGGQGVFKVPGYPSNVAADPNFAAELTHLYSSANNNFGRSVNGISEYLGSGGLRGRLLSADFAGSKGIITVDIDDTQPNLLIKQKQLISDAGGNTMSFLAPLDVLSVAGSDLIYVADFGNRSNFQGGGLYYLTPAN